MRYQSTLKACRLQVRRSHIHGYGVFALEAIAKGALIEECGVLLSSLRSPDFEDYMFGANDKAAIALGYGSFYNHAMIPNAGYKYDTENNLVIFTAQCAIRAGEEITINYGESWFSSRDMPIYTPFRLRSLFKSKWWRRPFFRMLMIVVLFVVLKFLINLFAFRSQ